MTAREIFTHILNVISPAECGSCGNGTAIFPFPVCENCICEILSSDTPDDIPLRLVKRTYACLEYTQAIKCCIKSFKFNGNRKLTSLFKRIIGSHILISGLRSKKLDLIIPVPLHNSRKRKRGYNQSGILSDIASTFLSIPVHSSSLVKTRNTPPQSGLGKQERSKNLRGSFAVTDKKAVLEKNVLLMDDVITTGATMEECARALLSAGACSVSALALARVT